VTARDIVRIARQRSGLTQQQLAERSGHPRETIARWETGAREPSLASLDALVAACDLDLVIHLARRDRSLNELVADQLTLTPAERVRRLMPSGASDDTFTALHWLARARTPVIVIGSLAAVLQGGPQPPSDASVAFVTGDPFAMEAEMRRAGLVPIDTASRWSDADTHAEWELPGGPAVVLASNIPGTQDYRDLRRAARTVELDDTSIAVAHPRDLLRIADASPRESERARVPGLRALLSHATVHAKRP
jgi:transcriptional regulator with XRE-family HTH domain